MNTTADKLANGVMSLKQEKEELEKMASQLKERNQELEKRARAEQVLLKAKDKPNKFNVSTVDEFLSKRAQLEDTDDSELEKIATAIDFIEAGDGITIDDYESGGGNGDFNDWLKEISYDNF